MPKRSVCALLLLGLGLAGCAEVETAEVVPAPTFIMPVRHDWLERAAAQGSRQAKAELAPSLAASNNPEDQKRGEQYGVEFARLMSELPSGKSSIYKVQPALHSAALRMDFEETVAGPGA